MDHTYTYQSFAHSFRRGRRAARPARAGSGGGAGRAAGIAGGRRAGALPVDSPLRRRLPPLLRRAWFSLNQTFRRLCAKTDLTPDQFTVLRTLHERQPAGLTQRELADIMTSDANTIASLLARMEESGLVERGMDPADRRANRIYLRPAGRRKYSQTRLLAMQLQRGILRKLPAARREVFLKELEIIADACRSELKKSG
jgi:DNA-binding MarR family transcriptional regulator